jgi:hypothetical protein
MFKAIGGLIKLFLVVYLPLICFGFFMIGFIAIVIADPKKDLTSFLSVSFGMLIALSSVCFSWVKTIDERDVKSIRDIKICGESFMLTAIFLIVAIALKYISIQLSDVKFSFQRFIGHSCFYLFYIIIFTIMTYFIVAFSKLLHLLFLRVDNSIREI